MLAWLKALVGRRETALESLETDEITAEEMLRILQRVRREVSELRLEWGEHLDKLTRISARMSARERGRRRLELEREEEEEEEEPQEAPHSEPKRRALPAPAVPPYNPFDKQSIRAHLAARRNGH